MKAFTTVLATLALIALGASCTFGSQTKAGLGRVIIGAQAAQRSNGPTTVVGQTKKQGAHALQRSAPRNLSASTDISSITYTLWDLTNPSTTPVDSGSIDLSYLSLELFLTPGNSYRLIVDVALTASFSGSKVGVLGYGDQSDFTVNDGWDTYVDLTVHPTNSYVIDPASLVSGSTSTIAVFNPVTGTKSTKNLFAGPLTQDPADRFFFGPDSRLYYFNKVANKVFWWRDMAKAMTNADAVVDGATGLGNNVVLASACSDPVTADVLWLVGKDTSDSTWRYYTLYDASNNPSGYFSDDISSQLSGTTMTTPTLDPTSIAVDTWGDVYISYTATDGSTSESGVDAFANYYGTAYAMYPAASQTVSDYTSSVFTDVVWDQGKLWVLASANTALPGAANTGTADIVVLDDYLESLPFPGTAPTPGVSNGSLAPLSGTTLLVLPNRITGPIQSRNFAGTAHPVLYFSQQDFQGTGSAVLSELKLDDGTIASY